MKVTHILVKVEMVNEPNPNWCRANENIEPPFIQAYKNTVIHFYSEKEVKNYIAEHPDILNSKGATFYKVEELKPKRTVQVTIDV